MPGGRLASSSGPAWEEEKPVERAFFRGKYLSFRPPFRGDYQRVLIGRVCLIDSWIRDRFLFDRRTSCPFVPAGSVSVDLSIWKNIWVLGSRVRLFIRSIESRVSIYFLVGAEFENASCVLLG